MGVNLLGTILVSVTSYPSLTAVGTTVGKLYTDHGLPIDMALSRLPYSHEQKIAILDGVFNWIIEHKHNSGASEKNLERQRQSNQKAMLRFINSKDTEAY